MICENYIIYIVVTGRHNELYIIFNNEDIILMYWTPAANIKFDDFTYYTYRLCRLVLAQYVH